MHVSGARPQQKSGQNMDRPLPVQSPAFISYISVLMVIAGALNTLCIKWTDTLKADGHTFLHPFIQAQCMFTGELLCLPAFFISHFFQRRKWRRDDLPGAEEPRLPHSNPLWLAMPSICDLVSTSMMYIGLSVTTASAFQMIRGAIIIVLTGLLYTRWLGREILPHQWLGMFVVSGGLLTVGAASILFDNQAPDDPFWTTIGVTLIVLAQLLVAYQLNYEDDYMQSYEAPALYIAGFEGLFGSILMCGCLVGFYFIRLTHSVSTNPDGRLEDVIYAWKEIRETPMIGVALGLTVISAAFFNYACRAVTKTYSATARVVVDAARTLIVWAVSLGFFGDNFIPLQVVGWVLLLLGLLIYGDILIGPWFRRVILPRIHGWWCLGPCAVCICAGAGDPTSEEREAFIIPEGAPPHWHHQEAY